MQTGTANVQRNISTRSAEIRAALSEFISSPSLAALPPADRQSLIDFTDVPAAELDKPEPD